MKSKTKTLTLPKPPEPSIGIMLQEVLNRGITNENVGTLEKMLVIYEHMEDRKAEQEFASAFNKLSKKIPSIKATKPVPGKDGTVRFKYEPLYKIEKKLRPLALAHGFTYTFSELAGDNGRVTKACTVQHIGGHKRSNAFTVRSATPPHANESQGSMADHTYAKRGALCDAFGIVVEHDDNARMQGSPITQSQADELRQMVRESGSDEAKFLKWAGAEKYEEILDSKLDFIYDTLERKIRGVKISQDSRHSGDGPKTAANAEKDTESSVPGPSGTEQSSRDPITGEFKW